MPHFPTLRLTLLSVLALAVILTLRHVNQFFDKWVNCDALEQHFYGDVCPLCWIDNFLLLSIPSFSTRIVPLRFQAGGHGRRPNLGLVCVLLCNLCWIDNEASAKSKLVWLRPQHFITSSIIFRHWIYILLLIYLPILACLLICTCLCIICFGCMPNCQFVFLFLCFSRCSSFWLRQNRAIYSRSLWRRTKTWWVLISCEGEKSSLSALCYYCALEALRLCAI